jgi:hypothetical protein
MPSENIPYQKGIKMTNQLPAHLQNRQRRDLATAAIGGLNMGSPPHISIAGNRFTLIDDAGNEKPIQTLFLDVCVIDANQAVSKIYFDPRIPFEPGGDNSNPPICWSDNGIGASVQASVPQNTSCQMCPQNAWGSATSKATGKPVKACNDVKKLAVLIPGMEMVFLLRVPPASLKNLAKYTQTLAGHGVDLPDAVTRLEFESQGVLKFTPMGYVDAATAALTDKVIVAKATDNLVGRNDKPWGGQADAQKIAYAQQQAPAIAAPAASAAQPMAPPPQPFGGQQAIPASNVQNAFGGNQPAADPFGQAGTSSPTDATPPKTRKPRTPKVEPTAQADDGIPPFLQRNPATPAAPAPNPTQFGMQQNPPAPDADIQAALDAAFRLPT